MAARSKLGVDAQSPVLTDGADIQSGEIVFDYTSTDPATTIRGLMSDNSNITLTTIHDSSPPSNCSYCAVCIDNTSAYQVTATYTVPGDANLDGTVNASDLNIVNTNYGESGKTWLQGDFDGDGTVYLEDMTIVLANYAATADPLAPQAILISRLGASPTTANRLEFVVAFSQGVTGVDASDFQLVCSGTTGTISSVIGYGAGAYKAVYVVTVSRMFSATGRSA